MPPRRADRPGVSAAVKSEAVAAFDRIVGIVTGYAHQSQLAVSQGQTVTQGQVIGYEGSTGDSTGPHLHFEVRVNGSPQNPRSFETGSP